MIIITKSTRARVCLIIYFPRKKTYFLFKMKTSTIFRCYTHLHNKNFGYPYNEITLRLIRGLNSNKTIILLTSMILYISKRSYRFTIRSLIAPSFIENQKRIRELYKKTQPIKTHLTIVEKGTPPNQYKKLSDKDLSEDRSLLWISLWLCSR
jgi:hypothetical protein